MRTKDAISDAIEVLREMEERERVREQQSAGRWIQTVDGEILWREAWEDEANESEQGKRGYRPLATKTRGYTAQSSTSPRPRPSVPEQKLVAKTEQERKDKERKLGVRVPMPDEVKMARAADPDGTKFYKPPHSSAGERLQRGLDTFRATTNAIHEQEAAMEQSDRKAALAEGMRDEYRKQAYRES